jgi:hypothetical protein
LPSAIPEKNQPDYPPGVIRLLMAGHFKGVADVRLRINFFEELNAIQAGKLQDVAGEKVPGLVESVQQTVQSLLSSGQLSEEQSASLTEQLKGFTQSVNQVLEDFKNSPNPDKEGLISGLNAAFENLTSFIAGIFPATAPDPQAEGVPAASDTPAPATTATSTTSGTAPTPEETEAAAASAPESTTEAFLGDLRSVYETALASLQKGMDQADALPPLSEPEGQGKAYAKFVAIYQNLAGGADPAENPEKDAIISTSA